MERRDRMERRGKIERRERMERRRKDWEEEVRNSSKMNVMGERQEVRGDGIWIYICLAIHCTQYYTSWYIILRIEQDPARLEYKVRKGKVILAAENVIYTQQGAAQGTGRTTKEEGTEGEKGRQREAKGREGNKYE